MRRTRLIIPLVSLAALVALGLVLLSIQKTIAPPSRYFSETGHLVREPFLSFFNEHGGIETFGYPLTEAYNTSEGILTQTFQRARLQLSVRGVELAPIGRALHLGDESSTASVDEAFRAFYEDRGGEAFFGPPLGPAREENGLLVQDFERARLVRDRLGEVRLANLGSVYLSVFPPPAGSEQAALRLRGTPTPPPDIRLSVSVEHPAIGQGEQQTIYLYVEDEEGNPVAGAQALAVLHYNGVRAEVELPETDDQGLARATFVAPPALPGTQVIVEVHALVGETLLTVETTYFQWW